MVPPGNAFARSAALSRSRNSVSQERTVPPYWNLWERRRFNQMSSPPVVVGVLFRTRCWTTSGKRCACCAKRRFCAGDDTVTRARNRRERSHLQFRRCPRACPRPPCFRVLDAPVPAAPRGKRHVFPLPGLRGPAGPQPVLCRAGGHPALGFAFAAEKGALPEMRFGEMAARARSHQHHHRLRARWDRAAPRLRRRHEPDVEPRAGSFARDRGAPGRGAGRGRLVRQFVDRKPGEAVVGRTLGLLVAHANVDLFSRFRIPGAVPVALDVRLDLRVVLFTLVVSALSALLFDSRAPDEQSGTRAGVEVRTNLRRETASALRAERAGRRALRRGCSRVRPVLAWIIF
jgi:hypothetical protein